MTVAGAELSKLKRKYENFYTEWKDDVYKQVREFLFELGLNETVLYRAKTDLYIGKIIVDEIDQSIMFVGRNVDTNQIIRTMIAMHTQPIMKQIINGTMERRMRRYEKYEEDDE